MPQVLRFNLPYFKQITAKPSEFPLLCSDYLSIPRLRKLALFLLPSFLVQSADLDKPKAIKRDTDYLDGLRGVAAFIVVIQHFIQRPYPAFGFGYGSSAGNWHLLQLPFIRLMYSGGTMVAVFFVISGFALSSKGIQLIRGQSTSMFKVLSSTTFRRSVRLFLPSVTISFIAFLLQRMGYLNDHPAHRANNPLATKRSCTLCI